MAKKKAMRDFSIKSETYGYRVKLCIIGQLFFDNVIMNADNKVRVEDSRYLELMCHDWNL